MARGKKLTHLRASGEAHMVDVSAKPTTERIALAEGFVRMAPKTLDIVLKGEFAMLKFLLIRRFVCGLFLRLLVDGLYIRIHFFSHLGNRHDLVVHNDIDAVGVFGLRRVNRRCRRRRGGLRGRG